MKIDHRIAVRTFDAVGSHHKRLTLIEQLVSAKGTDERVADFARHFVVAFRACSENRNALMHARPVSEGLDLLGSGLLGSNTLAFAKAPKNDPTATNYARLSLPQLRSIADEIHASVNFGRDVFLWTHALSMGGKITLAKGDVYEPPLPEKPPLPSRIDWQSKLAPQSEPPPPESSQG